MIRMRFLFSLLLLLPAALPANLRAPWQIQTFPAFSLLPGSKIGGLTVLGETLEFQCGSLYEGEPDLDRLQKSACKVKAAYRISSERPADAGLEFVGPSAEGFTALVNGKPSAPAVSAIPMQKENAAKYGSYPVCRFCSSEDVSLFAVRFRASLGAGENTIIVSYTQPLSSDEVSYGYFKDSRWAQGFDYELWPLKEWKLAPDFRMHVRITSPRPGFWARMFEDHPWKCYGVALGQRPPLPVSGTKGPGIDPGKLKQSPLPLGFSSDTWQWSLELDAAFPDRLSCSME